jgi:hypothetical protein
MGLCSKQLAIRKDVMPLNSCCPETLKLARDTKAQSKLRTTTTPQLTQ